MKPTMLFAIVMLTAIVLITSFDLQFGASTPIAVPESMAANVLYVCPVASGTWDAVARALMPFTRSITIGFLFAAMILMFSWGWALYQNLLKDSFKRESFKNPWAFTKMWFWAGVIVLMAALTPNHFREVHLTGSTSSYVLCDNNTPGARAVRASAVHN
ncbi:MAG: hypothetical protein Q4E56_03955 [Pseudomonadota bacterium]|nr:hypothetical protein [Pseudomonadota bacterium]